MQRYMMNVKDIKCIKCGREEIEQLCYNGYSNLKKIKK